MILIIQAYIRLGKVQHFLKAFHKALDAYKAGLELDPDNDELKEARQQTLIAIRTTPSDPERQKEALKDPEIMAIMRNPVISQVLQDWNTNPQTAQKALEDPVVAAQIERLIAAGAISVA